jgi:hypothetical protein
MRDVHEAFTRFKRFPLSPILGGLAVAGGVVLVVVEMKKKF